MYKNAFMLISGFLREVSRYTLLLNTHFNIIVTCPAINVFLSGFPNNFSSQWGASCLLRRIRFDFVAFVALVTNFGPPYTIVSPIILLLPFCF